MDEIRSLGTQAAKLIESIGKVKFPIIMILLSVLFMIFSLVYNDRFMYYGFITFIFGLFDYGLASILNRVNEFSLGRNCHKLNLAYSIIEFIIIVFYVYVLISFAFYDFNPYIQKPL